MIAPATAPELPRDLAPWRQELELFPADLVLSLQGPLRRLRGLVGSLGSPTLGGVDDPDGYRDLARRGPYERLVASEWLLAEEVPEEFDRRAAMGEHLFLELAHRSPRPRGRSLALFDAGPDQLGAPRVAQLAILILLAGRARTGGAVFQWGLVQEPDLGWMLEVTKGTVLGFLEGRSAERVGSAYLERWEERWGEPDAADDLWLVGSPRLTCRAPELGASALTIEDPLVAGRRSVQVRADRPGVRPRVVDLELPAEGACVRMLRDPFAISVAGPERTATRPDAGAGLRFAAAGDRVLVREGGGLAAYNVPNSARVKAGKPRRLRLSPGEELVAGGFRRGSLLAATLSGHTLTLHGVPWPGAGRAGGKLVVGLPPDQLLTPAGEGGPLGLCYYPYRLGGPRPVVTVIDPTGRGIEVAPGHLETLGKLGGRVVAADATLATALLIVEDRGGVPGVTPWSAVEWVGAGTANTIHSGFSSAHALAPVFGYGVHVYAVAAGEGRWQVMADGIERELHPGSGCGAVAVAREGSSLGLVILEEDQRTFSLAGLQKSRILMRSEREVVAAVGCRARPIFAFLTAAGDVVVYSIPSQSVISRVSPREGT